MAADREGHFQRLLVVEAGIDEAPVGVLEIALGEPPGSTHAFCDVTDFDDVTE